MLSSEIRTILASAASFANENGHSEVSDLVVLLALLEVPRVRALIDQISGHSANVRNDLYDKIDEMAAEMMIGDTPDEFRNSDSLLYILQVAQAFAVENERSKYDAMDLFYCMAADSKATSTNNVRNFLIRHGITATAVAGHFAREKNDDDISEDFFTTLNETDPPTTGQLHAAPLFEFKAADHQSKQASMLMQFCDDRTAAAKAGKIDPIYNRDLEIGRVVQILSRKKKNNPILLGEPGVGKTAIVDGLALRIAQGRVPEKLLKARILSLNVGMLIGGTKYRGEFEERITKLLAELEADPAAILFIDEIHMIVQGSIGDAADLMKPALASGKLACIGATTHAEYMMYFEKDAALARRFQSVDVKEPTRDQAVDMLKGLVDTYSTYHKVSYLPGTVEAAVDLSIRHIVRQRLPDKAIDIVDEAGARARAGGHSDVTMDMIREVVSSMSGRDGIRYPPQKEMEALLKAEIQGQEEACEQISSILNRVGLGLSKASGTRSVMVFRGKKGSGRNHAIKALATITGMPVTLLNMQQYPDHASMTRMIGSPPGYLGFDQGGQLTEAIRRKPSALLVVEHLADAWFEASDILKDMMSKGQIKDAAGRDIPCRDLNVIILLDEREQGGNIGFRFHDQEGELDDIPEDFRNYVDGTVTFANVDRRGMSLIVQQLTNTFREKLAAADISLQLSQAACDFVVEGGLKAGTVSGGIKAFRSLVQEAVYNLPLERGVRIGLDLKDGKIVATIEEGVMA
jgi:ATP-dependent Clp protease ATP-binding subunit ClpA